jgi:hypothetical protein
VESKVVAKGTEVVEGETSMSTEGQEGLNCGWKEVKRLQTLDRKE